MAFYMLVGVSGSGKSTFAKRIKHWGELEKENVEIFSSDEIRKELYGNASIQKDHEKVFRILHKRVKEALSQGKSVVYENTDILWRGKFDSSNFYADMEIGKTYNVTLVGFRIPFFSWYENIVSYEEIE